MYDFIYNYLLSCKLSNTIITFNCNLPECSDTLREILLNYNSVFTFLQNENLDHIVTILNNYNMIWLLNEKNNIENQSINFQYYNKSFITHPIIIEIINNPFNHTYKNTKISYGLFKDLYDAITDVPIHMLLQQL